MSSLLSLSLIGLLALAQSAQDEQDTENQEEDRLILDPANRDSFRQNPDWRYSASISSMLYPSADFDASPGDVSTWRFGLRIGGRRPIGEDYVFSWNVNHERSQYDFSDDNSLGGINDPFGRTSQTSVGSSLRIQTSEDVAWFTSVFARAGGEAGASLSDAAVFGGGGTVSFPAFENVRLTLGGFVTTRLEDDPLFFPWFQVDWEVTERLHIGSEGSGVGVGYLFSDQVRTYANFFFAVRQYRLRQSSGNPLPGGVGRDQEFGLNLGATWTVNRKVRADFFGGITSREITLLDDNVAIAQSDLDPAPYLGISVSVLF